LLFDSGIRSGEGIAKALVSGANFVMLGRPFLYALGANGPDGLRYLLDMLANELSIVMAQLGCNDVTQLNRSMLVTDL
jgi:L-lactate dehydrogenase (cytochrome)